MESKSIGFSESTKNAEGSVSLGKCWAALRGEKVIGTVSMSAPNDIDYDEYRKKVVDALTILGNVKSGEIIEREGGRYFVQRISHPSLRKGKVEAKEFELTHPMIFSGRPLGMK